MLRWQRAALCVALCSGCLEPMVSDDPGYSRFVLPPGTQVESAYADLQISRKIDNGDGLAPPLVKIKSGFAAGAEVKYWDLGAAKRAAAPAYALAVCGPDGRPTGESAINRWPFIVETIPGDGDYSPYRAINWVCITPKYKDEIINSSDALSDAVELGLVSEPRAADIWVNVPIVSQGLEVEWPGMNRATSTAYYKGKTVQYHSFEDQEGRFGYDATKPFPVANAYDIVRIGQPGVVRTIFSQPYTKDGARNPAYTPQWMLYTVTLKALVVGPDTTQEMEAAKEAADIQMWDEEADIVNVPMAGSPTPRHTRVLSVTPNTTNPRINRPFVVQGLPQ